MDTPEEEAAARIAANRLDPTRSDVLPHVVDYIRAEFELPAADEPFVRLTSHSRRGTLAGAAENLITRVGRPVEGAASAGEITPAEPLLQRLAQKIGRVERRQRADGAAVVRPVIEPAPASAQDLRPSH